MEFKKKSFHLANILVIESYSKLLKFGVSFLGLSVLSLYERWNREERDQKNLK